MTLTLTLLILAWTTALASEDCDSGKDFVCIDTVHYKVCLPPELKRANGDEPVVRCPAATRCDERSPWRCSTPDPLDQRLETTTAVYMITLSFSSNNNNKCPAKGDFPVVDGGGGNNYWRCEAEGAQGELRSCEGDAQFFDPQLRECVTRMARLVHPQQQHQEDEEQQEEEEEEEQEEEQQQQRRSKRGVVVRSDALTSPPLLDLLFEESDASADAPTRERREAGQEEAAGRKKKKSDGHTKTKHQPRRMSLLVEELTVKAADGKDKEANKSPGEAEKLKSVQGKGPDKAQESLQGKSQDKTEESLQRKGGEWNEDGLQQQEKSVDSSDLSVYSGIWLDRSKELLEKVTHDRERWGKMGTGGAAKGGNRFKLYGRMGAARSLFHKGKREDNGNKQTPSFIFRDPKHKSEEEEKEEKEGRGKEGAKRTRACVCDSTGCHGHCSKAQQQQHRQQKAKQQEQHEHRHRQKNAKHKTERSDRQQEKEGGELESGEEVLKDKGRRGGDLVHFAGAPPRTGEGSKKSSREVYVVQVSSVPQSPKAPRVGSGLQQAAGGANGGVTECEESAVTEGRAEKAKEKALEEEKEAEKEEKEAEKKKEEAEEKKEQAEKEVMDAEHEEVEEEKAKLEEEEKKAAASTIKTLDFSGSLKISDQAEECLDTNNNNNANNQLLDINFDQLMEDRARAAVAKQAGGGGEIADGRLYALPELASRCKAEELSTSQPDATPQPVIKKSAPAVSGVKAPPEGLVADVQQQLMGGAVEMVEGGQEVEPGELEVEEKAAPPPLTGVTVRDVFRGRRRPDGGQMDVNATVLMSNETFSPPGFSCEGREGRFADPSSRHRYFSCAPSPDGSTFRATRLVCPQGLLFLASLGECARKEDVLPPSNAARPPPPPPCPADMVLDRASGLCVRNDVTSRCPQGTTFDPSSGDCRREQPDSSDHLYSLQVPLVTSPRRCRRPGRVANPGDCASFFLCVPERRSVSGDHPDSGSDSDGFRRLLVVCPRDSVFEPFAGRCVAGNPGTCTTRRRRCLRPGRFKDSEKEKERDAYVLCTGDLTPLRMRCPRGQVFSQGAGHCVAVKDL